MMHPVPEIDRQLSVLVQRRDDCRDFVCRSLDEIDWATREIERLLDERCEATG